jgi:hypothetical protein
MSALPVLKSSADWQEMVQDRYIVRDPDGWDRANFSMSWAELITFEEFEERAHMSTIQFTPEYMQKLLEAQK